MVDIIAILTEVAVLADNIKAVYNKHYAEVAQLVEHTPEERGVTSSNLVLGTIEKHRPRGVFVSTAIAAFRREEGDRHTSFLHFAYG